ncbi:MAG: hypothetical protein K0R82_2818 [Flavipsychrobacter sp.]|nr:hypothetical protein [Flavipsychrobacter sp.]
MKHSLAIIIFTILISSCKKEYTCACHSLSVTSSVQPMEINSIVKGRNREKAERSCAELDMAQGDSVACYLK